MSSNLIVIFVLLIAFINYQLTNAQDEVAQEHDAVDNGDSSIYYDVIYNYTEPKMWPLTYPSCSSIQQSPIYIEPDKANTHISKKPLFWISYNEEPDAMTIKNDGNLVVVSGIWRGWPHVAGSILKGTYKFVELRFHWGLSPTKGPEHIIGKNTPSMEVQFVHYKSDYENLENALMYPDGVTIVSRFYDATKNSKAEYLDELGEMLMNITMPDTEIDFTGFALDKLNPPFNEFYTYLGSLTQPPCSESVIWIIASSILPIPYSIWELFITLQSRTDGVMGDNYRPVQDLNSRLITKITQE